MTTTTKELRTTDKPADWLAVMDQAISEGDELRLWQALYEHPDQEEAHRRLAELVPRAAYRLGDGSLRTVELLFAPAVCNPRHPLFGEEGAWPQYSRPLQDALYAWLQPQGRMSTFAGLRPYDWVGTWRPGVLREHLLSVIPGRSRRELEFLTNWLDLPEEAPRLGFFIVAITNDGHWLQLPPASSRQDVIFSTTVSGLLHYNVDEEPPSVLPPLRVSHAVASGLRLWLAQLHSRVAITGWTVAPHEQSLDVVKVTLELDSESVPYTQFPIRRHQIGLKGLHEVLSDLSGLAPMLDKPIDVSAGERGRSLELA